MSSSSKAWFSDSTHASCNPAPLRASPVRVNLKNSRGCWCDLRLRRCSNFAKQQGIIQSDEVKACRALQSRRQVLCSPETRRSDRPVRRSKMLADIVWLGFMICGGLRMFSYVPRIWRIAADKTGAAAISCTMWGVWAAAYVAAAVYAAAGLHNTWLAFGSAIYAACCVTVIVLTMLKRSGWRIRVTSPLL
jgi:hypothetical protein